MFSNYQLTLIFDKKVDFNQGLDARLIANNKQIAELLSKVKWMKYLRNIGIMKIYQKMGL